VVHPSTRQARSARRSTWNCAWFVGAGSRFHSARLQYFVFAMTNAQILAAQKLFQSMTGKAPVHLKAGRCAKREECSALAVALV